jgi:Nucleotidyl transferase AbiEii toxin, Type IV TA system
MNLEQIRRVAIIALFSDDLLVDKLVLKGGNALRLVYGIGVRSSVDIDVSIDKDFDDFEDVEARLSRALTNRFESVGYVVFDFSFKPKPSIPLAGNPPLWGGYELVFKLIERLKHGSLKGGIEGIRRNATVIGPEQQRIFRVDMSRHEFVDGKTAVELDGFVINVYTPAMIAVEKLRAICQQMKAYPQRNRRARARDFYDIYAINENQKLDLLAPETVELVSPVFAAKDVPLSLLSRIPQEREFHRADWPSVQATVSGRLEPFDFYFDFVTEWVHRLEARGIE